MILYLATGPKNQANQLRAEKFNPMSQQYFSFLSEVGLVHATHHSAIKLQLVSKNETFPVYELTVSGICYINRNEMNTKSWAV